MYKKSQKNITLEFTPGSFAVQPQSAITFLGVTSLVEELQKRNNIYWRMFLIFDPNQIYLAGMEL